MRHWLGFLFRFLLLAAGLFALWSFAGFGDAYGRAVIEVAGPFILLVADCEISSVRQSGTGLDVVLRRQGHEQLLPLQPREVFSGIIPFLALVGASARLTIRHRLVAAAIGLVLFFVFHVGLMLIGTYLTGLPQALLSPESIRNVVNPAIDILYGFYGLVGYAALPFFLWFWLTQESSRRAMLNE